MGELLDAVNDTQYDKTFLGRLQRGFGQAGAGLSEVLLSSPKSANLAEALVPGGVREMLELPNVLYELSTGSQIPLEFFQRNRELQQATREASGELFGVGEPRNTGEMITRLGTSALIPSGPLAKAAPAAQAATKSGLLTSAARYLLPLNQGRTVGQRAVEAGVGLSLPAVITEALGASGVVPQEQVSTVLKPTPPPSPLQAAVQELQLPKAAPTPKVAQTGNPLVDAVNTAEVEQQKEGLDITTELLVLGAMTGSFVLGRQAWRNHKASLREFEEFEKLRTQGNVGGRATQSDKVQVNTPRDEIAARTVDSLLGLERPVERKQGFGSPSAEKFKTDISLKGNPISSRIRTDSMMETGEWAESLFYPGTQQKIKLSEAPAPFIRTLRNAPNREEVYELIRLRDELDNRRFGALASLNRGDKVPRSILNRIDIEQTRVGDEWVTREFDVDNLDLVRTQFTDMDNAQLKARIAELTGNPETRVLADRYGQLTRGVLDYARARGFITAEEAAQLAAAHPNYMPRRMPRPPRNRMDEFFGQLDEDVMSTDWERSFLRNREFEDLSQDTAKMFVDPATSLDMYLRGIQRSMDLNEIRRQFFAKSGKWKTHKDVKGRVPENFVPVRVPFGSGHRTLYYEVNDPFIRHLLKFQAPIQQTFFNTARRLFQLGATGPGAPFFAFTSLLYDASLLPRAATRAKGNRVGLLPNSIASRVGDLTALPLSMTEGVARGLWGTLLKGARSVVDESIANNGIIPKLFGELTPQLQENLARAVTNSSLHMLEKIGAVSSRFGQDADTLAQYGAYLRSAGKTPIHHRVFNSYRGVLDAIQNAARLQYMRRNYKPGMSNAELQRLGRDIREITADFSRAPAGNIASGRRSFTAHVAGGAAGAFTRSIPYGNVALQAMRRYANMIRENPMAFAAGAMTTTMIPAATTWFRTQQLGEEYVDYYWNQLSWQDRLTKLYWFKEGEPPQNAVTFRMLPEDAVVLGTFMALMDSVMGWTNGMWKDQPVDGFGDFMTQLLDADASKALQDMMTGAAEGTSRIANPGVPPVLQGAMAAGGYQVKTDFARMLRGQGGPLRFQQMIGGYEKESGRYVSNAIHNEVLQGILLATLGTAGRTITGMAEAADRAFVGTGGQSQPFGKILDTMDKPLREAMQAGADTQLRMLPVGTTLFGDAPYRSVWGSRAQMVRDKESAIKNTVDRLRTVMGNEDVTNQQRLQQTGLSLSGGNDPLTIEIASNIDLFWKNGYTQKIVQEIDTQWELLTKLQQRVDISYEQKLRERNQIAEKLQAATADLYEEMQRVEAGIAEVYGVPDFTFESFSLD